ncbi:hypothetical protein BH09BAC1_BH09BAC1_14560 [soil metagenome]
MKSGPYIVFWALLLLTLTSCGSYVPQQLIHSGSQLPISSTATLPLHIQFNGVTSFIIRYGNSVVLTDPFVSNPPFKTVLFGKLYPNTEAISKAFRTDDLAQVKLVTISHAHYDHLMDLPSLLCSIPNNAIIAGSSTMAHIMVAAKPKQQLLSVNNLIGTDSTLGQWIYSADSTVRMMPFVSDHPPHIFGIKLYPGPYTEDLKEIPVKGKHWKQGLSLTFIIDFMEAGKPVYRVYSQSSSAHGKMGLFPREMLDEKPVDIVLISQAVKGKKTDYSEVVIKHCKAPIVFCTHWENFFRKPEQPWKAVPKAKVAANFQYLQTTEHGNMVLILPKPGSKYLVGPIPLN